eukprot:IDg5472t1
MFYSHTDSSTALSNYKFISAFKAYLHYTECH